MLVAEWWSKYSTRRGTGGRAPEDDLSEVAPAPTRESFNRQRQLNVLALLLHSAGSMEEMLATLAEKGPEVTGASVVYPLLLDRRRDVLHAKALEGSNVPALDTFSAALEIDASELEFPLPAHSLRRRALEGGEVEVAASLGDLIEDVVGKPACQAVQEALGPRHVALAPMLMDGDPMGLVVFLLNEEELDRELLELLAGHTTLALKNLLGLEEMGRFGEVDQVTWLHNRRYLTEALEREVERAKRYRRSLSLIFLDIDRFSAFNENYGPSLGDRLLRSVGMLLAETLTEPEVVARLGGDDFALLLPEVNRAAAVSITTSVMTRLGQVTVFSGSGSPEPVSASVAIVCYPEDGATARDLMAAAASGLEQAKREKLATAADSEPAEGASEPLRRAG